MAPVGSESLGNTTSNSSKVKKEKTKKEGKKRISASKNWCFTWNNYTEDWFEHLDQMAPKIQGFIYGEEVGEEGTPHIQGYIEFKDKVRPLEFKDLTKKISWRKRAAHATRMDNITYCSKDGKWKSSGRQFSPPKEIKILKNLRPWQQEVVDIIKEEPDDRTIHWFHEDVGGIGKSALVKYLCVKHEAVLVSGKGADIKYQISSYEIAPELIIMDIPRSNLNYVNYGAIEEVKNGCFASSKYESKMCNMNCPHILCFANEPPDVNKMSLDRWDIINLSHLHDSGAAPLRAPLESASPPLFDPFA